MTHHRRQLITDLNVHFDKVCTPYRCRKPLLSCGIWDSSSNLIEIIHQHRSAAKCFLSMGMMRHSKLFLYPEEAIFLMQCSLLQVSLSNINDKTDIPIALNEAYTMWFDRLDHLHVYQYLTRVGFILIRHQPQTASIEKKQVSPSVAAVGIKRKRDEFEQLSTEHSGETAQYDEGICPIHISSDSERLWFPDYTTTSSLSTTKRSPRLNFPDRFSPIHINWLPADINSKVSNVLLSIYQSNTYTPRPSFSLVRSIDLQSHQSIYQRLTSFSPQLNPALSPLSSTIVFDMYTPSKHFRKSQPGLADYHIQIKNGNDAFRFEEIYHDQQTKTLTAIVQNGDICFYSFKCFDALEALQLK